MNDSTVVYAKRTDTLPGKRGPYYFQPNCYGDELEKMWDNHQGGPGAPEYYPHFLNVVLYESADMRGTRLHVDITLLTKPQYDGPHTLMEATVHVNAGADTWTTHAIFRLDDKARLNVAAVSR